MKLPWGNPGDPLTARERTDAGLLEVPPATSREYEMDIECQSMVVLTFAAFCLLTVDEPPNMMAGSSARAELRSFPSTLLGSVDGCGSSPFFALAASQELAQKYPLTTDMAMQAPLRRA